ncbi:MAG: sulfite exporter TauE/SafE family protein, partial [Chitinophagales bacterium]|nr:sulfite exporter TauE/SafE family protein [Chitinophagales bacterium]
VYVAIAGAVSTNDVLWSSSYMFAFGLGTMPIMALTMIFGKYISDSLRSKINRITPYLIGLMAILLIVRGLNLGIPYLSPKHEAGHTSCCHR